MALNIKDASFPCRTFMTISVDTGIPNKQELGCRAAFFIFAVFEEFVKAACVNALCNNLIGPLKTVFRCGGLSARTRKTSTSSGPSRISQVRNKKKLTLPNTGLYVERRTEQVLTSRSRGRHSHPSDNPSDESDS